MTRQWQRWSQWLVVIGWAVVISLLSTDTFSEDNTSAIIIPLLHWLFPHAGPASLEHMQFLVRKTAHFTEYFIFSVLLFWALRARNRGWQMRWAIWALLIAAGYSTFDEFHQSFVPSRTASAWDSLLDTTGASTAQIILGLWSWLKL